MREIRVCELFAGIGGFRKALETASSRFQTVYANEFNRYAAAIYRKHWNDGSLQEETICSVKADDLPDFDLLVGGFPCQPFSVAGRRFGINDPNGTLFWEILRVVKAKQPAMLLFENVPGLLSIDQGAVFAAMLQGLGELGYVCEWQIFNSRHFGVPQSRRRLFVVCHHRDRAFQAIFPIPTGYKSTKKSNGEKQVCAMLTSRYYKQGNSDNYVIQIKRTHAQGDDVVRVYQAGVPTLTAQMGTGGGNVPLILQQGSIRRLTPIECERLQGFSDGWTKTGLTSDNRCISISDTQRYKCLGNAVTVNVVAAIGKLIVSLWEVS